MMITKIKKMMMSLSFTMIIYDDNDDYDDEYDYDDDDGNSIP